MSQSPKEVNENYLQETIPEPEVENNPLSSFNGATNETTPAATENNEHETKAFGVNNDVINDGIAANPGEQKRPVPEKIDSRHENNLIVNYIPSDMDETQFRELFEPYGEIVSLKLVCDKATGMSMGYGFVMYDTKLSAEIAIRELNGKGIRGKNLKVAFAAKPGVEASNTNIYVANIDENAAKEAVEKMFGRYGKIEEMNVLSDKTTGKNKGIAFIRYEKRLDAERAIDELSGTNPPGIASRPLIIKVNFLFYYIIY